MKYIVKGGVTSRNVPANSMDALWLSMHSPHLSGVHLNVFLTKDQEVVLYEGPMVDHGKENIHDLTFRHLERRNFGTRIRRHSIVRLEDALKALNEENRMVLISLGDTKDLQLVKKVLEITEQFSGLDIYLVSEDKEIVLYLKQATKKQRVGVKITGGNENNWDMDVDFYVVDKNSINLPKMQSKIKQYKKIMIEGETWPFPEDYLKELRDSNAIYWIKDSIHTVTQAKRKNLSRR